MAPGGVQNEPKMQPKSRNMRWSTPNGPQMASRTEKFGRTRRFFTFFGSPLGPRNRPKNRLLEKIEVPGQQFSRFLLVRVLQPTFSLIFHRFLIEKSLFFSFLFSRLPCNVLDIATLTKHRYLHIETHFFIFWFLDILEKKCSKIQTKTCTPKSN